MASKFLDLSGLEYLWQKIKSLIPRKTAGILCGQVDSTSSPTEFTATIDGIDELYDGVAVYLHNGVIASASGWTLNINNLGALPVYSSMAAATRVTTQFNANVTALFIYNSNRVSGGCWDFFYGWDTDANSIGYQLRTNSSNLTATDAAARYRMWFTSADNNHWVPANTSTDTGATAKRTPNTRPINPFGRIVYRSVNGAVSANAGLGPTSYWDQYYFNLGYSFNDTGSALTLSHPAPVYLKCTPLADGSAEMIGIVQSLPTSKDGFIYIMLGVAGSATNIELQEVKPVYWHDGDGIRLWSGKETIQPPVNSVNGKTGAVVLDADDVGALPDTTVIPDVYQLVEEGTAIPENADMNDYTDVGVYYATGDVVLPTLTNAPFASGSYLGFMLEVCRPGGALTQRAVAYSGPEKTRYFESWASTPAWTEWKEIYLQKDKEIFKDLGTNPIDSTSDDTIANWKSLGIGKAKYGAAGKLINQPSTYGLLLNYIDGSDVSQIWHVLPTGEIYRRSGNASGWKTTFTKLQDEKEESSTVSMSSDITTVSINTLRKVGKTVMMTIRFTTPETVTSGEAIGTIPTGYRPATTLYSLSIKAWGMDGNCPVAINSNGSIVFINKYHSANQSYIVSATWLIS